MNIAQGYVAFLLGMGLALMWGASQAHPQAMEHSKKNPNHWYPPSCCSQRDCEPTPIDAIEEVSDGWFVRYQSPRLGLIDEKVPRSNARVKVNEHDGQYHGCWRMFYPQGAGTWQKPERMICFFYPLNV